MPRAVRAERHESGVRESGLDCAGVDGCSAGWVVATRAGIHVETSIGRVIDMYSVVGIDMPIGLPTDETRYSDGEARKYLGTRHSTVFPTPARICLSASNHADACAHSRAACGKAMSVQAWNLVGKIREVDMHVSPALEDRVCEVHPECSFAAMNGHQPLTSKHRAEGLMQRNALITQHFGTVPPTPRGARPDDVLDAYAVLWSVERFAAGRHFTFPSGGGQRDERGLLMRIVV